MAIVQSNLTAKRSTAYVLLTVFLCATSACKYQPQTEAESLLASQPKSVCPSADISSAPALAGPITDEANVFTLESKARLVADILKFEQNHQEQLVVVTVKSLAGQDIAGFTCNLARKWGIGNKDRNDGIVILAAPTERKLRIAVGYGLEKRLTNSILKSVIDKNVMPEFRRQQFETGIANAITEISGRLSGS